MIYIFHSLKISLKTYELNNYFKLNRNQVSYTVPCFQELDLNRNIK